MVAINFLLFLLLLLFSVRADDRINIGAILDVNTVAGRETKLSLQLALQDVNRNASLLNGTRLHLKIIESPSSFGNVFEMLETGVVAILVQSPMISKFLAPIAGAVQVPILSLTGEDGDGFGSASSRSSYLVSAVPSHTESDEMKAVAAIVEYFPWREVIVIYEDEQFWLSGVSSLDKALQQVGVRLSQTSAVSSLSDGEEIEEMLRQLNSSYVRAFIVYTSVDVGLKVFSVADELGMMKDPYAWVITDSIASSLDSFNSSSIQSVQGILGIRRPQLNSSGNRIGTQAYNCLTLIAKAVAAVVSEDEEVLQFVDNETPDNTTDFAASIKVLRGGELLLGEMNRLKSSGLVEMYTRGYEIINMAGRSYRTVGFWTKEKRVESPTKELNKLSDVIWPGDTAQVPNGYRKLRIGRIVGKKASNFNEFIGRLSGYTNDTFENAVNVLPYNLPVDYQAFDKGNSTLSNYDALVTELVNGKEFDAVVGDATILSNRSIYVDFTQPYSQTGLVMMVPVRKVRSRAWSFLYPFTATLWAVAGAFFVLTAFLMWLTEHQNNEEFKGGITQQIITSLTLSLSAFVFAQREEVKSGMGKGIVGIWLFMALILNSSYTAHLASILTVDKLEATIEDMNSLSRSNVKIGHMNGSFVKDYLISELNISEERLIPLGNPNEYLEKLISEEVGAIVEETPYVQIIRAQYPCAKFAIVDRGYFDTGGLGFFFRKGSPFLGDISRAVLNISERHHTIESIRSQWFGQQSSCPDLESGVQSNTNPIAPANLWILFVFTASVYAITAFIHIGRKLQQRRQRRGR